MQSTGYGLILFLTLANFLYFGRVGVQYRKHLRRFLSRSACGLALVPSSASSPLTFLGRIRSVMPRPSRAFGDWDDGLSIFGGFGKLKVGGLARCRSLQTVITAAALSRLRRSVGASLRSDA